MTEQEARAEERLVSAEVLDEYRKVVEWLERTAAVLGPAGDTMHGLAAEALSRLIEREQHRHRIPLYAMLDLWMALYQTSHPEFDEFYAEHGYAETWARLCAEVRARLSSRVVVVAPSETRRYEPCVLGSDGECTRWSHDHAAASQPVQVEVTNEMVERAADAIERTWAGGGHPNATRQEFNRARARAALTAALGGGE